MKFRVQRGIYSQIVFNVHDCSCCILCKVHITAIPRKIHFSTKQILDLVHSDVLTTFFVTLYARFYIRRESRNGFGMKHSSNFDAAIRALPANTPPYKIWHLKAPDLSKIFVLGSRWWYALSKLKINKHGRKDLATVVVEYSNQSKGSKVWYPKVYAFLMRWDIRPRVYRLLRLHSCYQVIRSK